MRWCGRGAKREAGYAKVAGSDDDAPPEDAEKELRNFDGCPSEEQEWPEHSSSLCARLLFSWFHPLIRLGAKASLELTDVWQLMAGDRSKPNAEAFWELWMTEKARAGAARSEPWLGWPIVHFAWRGVLSAGLMQLGSNLLSFASPLLMMQILRIVEGTPAIVPVEQAWVLAVARTACVFTQVIRECSV